MRNPYLLALIGGLALGFAWWFPGSLQSVALGWIATASLVGICHAAGHRYRAAFLFGLLIHLIGFYWLNGTIHHFGGFSAFPTFLVFALFTVLSSVQFLIFILFYHLLPQSFDRWRLRAAYAWVMAAYLSVRIFPWHMGHTQIGILSFVQIADLGGALLISFLMFWTAETVLIAIREQRWRIVWLPLGVCLLSVLYGSLRIVEFSHASLSNAKSLQERTELDVALIQANVSLAQKHSHKLFQQNILQYHELSRPYYDQNTLIVWPETVVMGLIPTQFRLASQVPWLPKFTGKAAVLFGTLMSEGQDSFYNSSVIIQPDRSLSTAYHKQILMPFGEYTPFGDELPWLRELNSTVSDFTPGKVPGLLPVALGHSSQTPVLVSPLICYEDVTPSLARRAVQAGAGVLINQTNDAWFGNTIAPYEHHLIASFRAIENRRYLLRATNTGLTAIVDPVGKTLSRLPIYTQGTLRKRVYALKHLTPYTRLTGDCLWWLIVAIGACAMLFQQVIGLRRRATANEE